MTQTHHFLISHQKLFKLHAHCDMRSITATAVATSAAVSKSPVHDFQLQEKRKKTHKNQWIILGWLRLGFALKIDIINRRVRNRFILTQNIEFRERIPNQTIWPIAKFVECRVKFARRKGANAMMTRKKE